MANTGATATTAGSSYYSATYNLSFSDLAYGCGVKIDGKDKFIVSNRSKDDLQQLGKLGSQTAVLYGGLGNSIQFEVNGAKKDIRIEPVGVIVLGIDGLRQDVLYATGEEQVHDLSASYFIPPANLKGMCDILGGRFNYDSCDDTGWENKHIKIPNVTAIFPSVTLASWASIFTGKMPGPAEDVVDAQGNVITPRGTGILGNEFFGRDLLFGAPHETTFNNPTGLITFDSGAFQGYDAFPRPIGLKYKEFFVPYQNWWSDKKEPVFRFNSADEQDPGRSPQNDRRLLAPDTVFETISAMPGVKKYFDEKGGDPVVVSYSHYSRGAYWVTWDATLSNGESMTMDRASRVKFGDYLSGKYGTLEYLNMRNNVPFSALTVWYLPGLDHEAHLEGMGIYKSYFQTVTDDHIRIIVKTLKELGEFDNKIFMIVADHGHTAMPEKIVDPDSEQLTEVFAKCELDLNMKSEKKRAMERNLNNNLHIWELGDYLKIVGEFVEQVSSQLVENKVLAPKEITKLFIDPATGQPPRNGAVEKEEDANIIAALNGPMAHVYVKGSNWSATPNIDRVLEVAEIFRVALQGAKGGDSPLPIFPTGIAEKFGYKIGRLSNSIDEILVRDGGIYKVYTVSDAAVSLQDINSLSSEYIDAVNRIVNMNNISRSGDIVLLMQDGTSGNKLDRYTTGVACKSWHGSLSRSDSYVPFIFAYPGGNNAEIENILKKDTCMLK